MGFFQAARPAQKLRRPRRRKHAGVDSACRKNLFDTLTGCKKVRKTSNSRPSAYKGTVGRELRRKSKALRSKLLPGLQSSKYSAFTNQDTENKNPLKWEAILTVSDFFDSLRRPRRRKHAGVVWFCCSTHRLLSAYPRSFPRHQQRRSGEREENLTSD